MVTLFARWASLALSFLLFSSAVVADESLRGFFDLEWIESSGQLHIRIDAFDEPFIYQSSLPRGIGSNDLGVDRGQLGATRLVRFVRSGPRVLMLQSNLGYRALSDNADEVNAVDESFADSVVWGFDVVELAGDSVIVDGTAFFLRDAHGLSNWLNEAGEGAYNVDVSRSAIYMPRTRAFPDNTEVEAILTYAGTATGPHLPTVAPDPSSITVHSHHSFIRLPEPGYEPLAYEPRSGVIGLEYGSRGFIDYASAIGEDMFVNFGRRHRLQKKNPEAAVSEAVEPIVYYVDRGAPEPVRSALIEGASWWNQAFEAAGYRDAFQVRMLPESADPMDVRYNVIQWVHRSTRGWSYGSSVLDPRTGEILKGHVTLGSLRVRQDYMIAEGLLSPYAGNDIPDAMLDMSLARIRQLSAHEVGHTIGFEHNFAASTQNRSSVMDYPFPKIDITSDGEISLDDAYAVGIGDWDKRTVIYAYQDFPQGVDADAGRAAILKETMEAGFRYVADADSRSVGSAHPHGNLWDNGADAIDELQHLLRARGIALDNFATSNVRPGRAMATLEEVLVPIYLLHRFQLHAVGKLIGGSYFNYNFRGDGQALPQAVDDATQRRALAALLATMEPDVLTLPDGLAEKITPRPPGIPKSRETFAAATGTLFDPLAPAASGTALTLQVLLDPARATRLNRSDGLTFSEVLFALLHETWTGSHVADGNAIRQQNRQLYLDALLRLAVEPELDASVAADVLSTIEIIAATSDDRRSKIAPGERQLALQKISRFRDDPESVQQLPAVTVPPGSPIGSAPAGLDW